LVWLNGWRELLRNLLPFQILYKPAPLWGRFFYLKYWVADFMVVKFFVFFSQFSLNLFLDFFVGRYAEVFVLDNVGVPVCGFPVAEEVFLYPL